MTVTEEQSLNVLENSDIRCGEAQKNDGEIIFPFTSDIIVWTLFLSSIIPYRKGNAS
jgi:hypothetical protein